MPAKTVPQMTRQELEEWSIKLYYAVQICKRLIGPSNQKGRGVSEQGRQLLAFELEKPDAS